MGSAVPTPVQTPADSVSASRADREPAAPAQHRTSLHLDTEPAGGPPAAPHAPLPPAAAAAAGPLPLDAFLSFGGDQQLWDFVYHGAGNSVNRVVFQAGSST